MSFIMGIIFGIILALFTCVWLTMKTLKRYEAEQPERFKTIKTEYKRFIVWVEANAK